MHCKAHNTLREKTASVVVPFGVSHWRTAYSVQLTGEQMEREPRKSHVAERRAELASCSKYNVEEGFQNHSTLNTKK